MILSVVFFATQAAAPPLPKYFSDETLTVIRTYARCLDTQSMRLEPSDASVDDILEAASTACAAEWADADEAVSTDLAHRPPSPTGKGPQTISVEFLESIKDGARRDLRLKILRLRADQTGK